MAQDGTPADIQGGDHLPSHYNNIPQDEMSMLMMLKNRFSMYAQEERSR